MLCLSGFELCFRWVPLLLLLAILSKKVTTKELFSSGGVSTNEVVALKLSILNWKVALSSFRLIPGLTYYKSFSMIHKNFGLSGDGQS